MLRELKINNFALIDNVTVEFNKGFNVLTGETGAGKSLLLDSIGLLCGNRASSDFIRKGQGKALVEGIFELNSEVITKLNSLNYIEIEDAVLIMSREISLSGGNKCKINYRVVPLNIYKDFGDILFEIHAQDQEQSIMFKDKQLNLLDKFIAKDEKTKGLLEEIKFLNGKYSKLLEEYNKLNQQEDYKKDLLEYYKFAIKEIEESQIKKNEDESLKNEKNIIVNAEKLVKYSKATIAEFNNIFLGSLNTIIYNLKEIEKIDNNITGILSKVKDIYYFSEDYFKEFKDYSQNFDFDENRLNEVEERLNHINKIKSKYGKSLAEVNAKLLEMEEEINRWINKDMELLKLGEELNVVKDKYLLKAEVLFKDRIKGAQKIEETIKNKLAKLNIYKEGFKIYLRKNDQINDKGSVEIEFLFSGNKGEDLIPLRKVASSGEISRIMLAFKEFFSELDFIPTLIFDEIDSGIGGETLLKIAEALEFIGRKRQVICVTHSPVIAAFAGKIITIKKVEEKERMKVKLRSLLKEEEIVKELSRMLGGDDNFITAKEQSFEILKFAKSKKKV